MRNAAVALLVAASAMTLPARWLHNPRERTAAGIAAWRAKDFQRADRDLEGALELGGEEPPLLYNAGTGRLGAGTPGAALPLLARAAAVRGPLQPEALYNLGNAYLAAGDPAAAADAYRAALRLRADHRPAKHNLELALRQLQQRPLPAPEQPPKQQGGGDGQASGGGNQQSPSQGSGGQQPPPPQQPAPSPQQQGQGQGSPSPRLPGFAPQKDMSADQAAALLEAVENLEREQRRAHAEQERRQRAREATEKDW